MAAPANVLLLAPPFALLTLGPVLLPPTARPLPTMEQAVNPASDENEWYFEDTGPEWTEEEDRVAVPARLENMTAAPTPVDTPLDALLDWGLTATAYELAHNGSRMRLPNFEKTFKANFGTFSAKGRFSAEEGSVGDLCSLFRRGPVSLLRDGEALLLHAEVGLKMLTLRYDHYTASVGRISVSGTIEAEASPAVVSTHVTLERPCGVRVRGVELSEMGPLSVRASGLGPLNRLVPLLSRWLDRRMRADVLRIVNEQLQEHARDLLRRFTCDD